LSFKSSEQSLRKHFSTVGEVREVRIAKDEEGKSRGFAHIEFGSESDA
jgi:RNA recognition motif-containing protein